MIFILDYQRKYLPARNNMNIIVTDCLHLKRSIYDSDQPLSHL